MKHFIWGILIFLNLSSCQRNNHSYINESTLLLAKSNSDELETVLQNYSQNLDDSLKYQAACFLIENMNVHLSKPSEELLHYFENVNATFKHFRRKEQYQPLYDSLTASVWYEFDRKTPEFDCRLIKSNYLSQNIEDAYRLWKLPWARHLSFEDFCEYLLPYKVNGDVIENWRSLYSNHLISLDSLLCDPDSMIVEQICERVSDSIYSVYGDNTASYKLEIPYTYPSALLNMEKGTCNQQTQLSTYFMRSLGIPVCIDFVPQWGNRSSGHTWNILKTPNKYPTNFNFSKLGHLEKVVLLEKVTKIYRRTYAKQKTNLLFLSQFEGESIPSFFDDPCLLDVTQEYSSIASLSDISIRLKKNITHKKFAYIAAFDNKKWVPVAWSLIEDDQVKFRQVGNEVIYMIVIYNNGTIIPATLPFILNKKGQIQYLNADKKNVQSMTISRKYPLLGLINMQIEC